MPILQVYLPVDTYEWLRERAEESSTSAPRYLANLAKLAAAGEDEEPAAPGQARRRKPADERLLAALTPEFVPVQLVAEAAHLSRRDAFAVLMYLASQGKCRGPEMTPGGAPGFALPVQP